MAKRYIIIADSAWELMMSIQVRLTRLKNDYVDIILTDRTTGSYQTYFRLKDKNVFSHVFYAEANHFPFGNFEEIVPRYLQPGLYNFACKKRVKEIIGKKRRYDYFITSEIDYFSRDVYKMLKPDGTKPILLGEGIFPYCGLETNILQLIGTKNDDLLHDYESIWVYGSPIDKIEYSEIQAIPSVNTSKTELIEVLNYIYGYEPHNNVYENKIIFFEESYSRDGGSDNAVEFVQKLVTRYGKECVMVKRHPRDIENRFKSLGVNSIEPYYIPWEIIILNGDCRHCILLAANSGSVYLTKLWDFTDEKLSCIMMPEILEYAYESSPALYNYYNFLKDSLYKKYQYNVPSSIEELYNCIDLEIKHTFVCEDGRERI